MHGQNSEEGQRMWPAPSLRSTTSPVDKSSVCKSFSKGGRKLSIGNCALFQAGNAPPFIGILRKVIQEKDSTKLLVNWLYRPADVKLAKGVPLEAAPNEIFYSFHKDEISAASLLHPCKVAFLRKGLELPSGVSSFVCRRVYDTSHKCLWWLTDRDYTDEHQDEVDQLIEKTRQEMQAAVQSGGPSPRSLKGPTPPQQLKSNSEVAQNATYHVPNKGKKRERSDQNLEPSKRERALKTEDGESSPLKRERSMKPEEIASITDKDGALQSPTSVERLLQLMQQDQIDGGRKTADMTGRRTMLAGVVAATEREDCLSRFVQLGGLPILDDWLQEAHKGKIGDGGSPKEGDKGVEEMLLTFLRALDRLPVDLDVLKACSVGKSVNHLSRSHKNSEVQKKAKKLVDIWKKRVDAEMKLSGEGKSSSNHAIWSTYKQSSPDVVHSHLTKGAPAEVAVKSSGASAGSAKVLSNGAGFVDSTSKSTAFSENKISTNLSGNSSSAIKKEAGIKLPVGNVASEVSALSVKDEKSCSSQSQSNGLIWANLVPGKGVSNGPWKEDLKSSSIVGTGNGKSVGCATRHTSVSGKVILGSATSSSKDPIIGKPLVWSRSAQSDKGNCTTPAAEKVSTDSREASNTQNRLIVRIANPGRSPARLSSGSFDQSLPASRCMSPNVTERNTGYSSEVPDSKSRLVNGPQNPPSVDSNSEAKISNGARPGGVLDDDRDKRPNPCIIIGEDGTRANESARPDTDMIIRECHEANRSSSVVGHSGDSLIGPDPEVQRRGDVLPRATTSNSADVTTSAATPNGSDEQGRSLSASVAVSLVDRKLSDDDGDQEHGVRPQNNGGTSQIKENGDKAVSVKDGADTGKDSGSVSGSLSTPVLPASLTTKPREDGVVESGGDQKVPQDTKSEDVNGEADVRDGERRPLAKLESGSVLNTNAIAECSVESRVEEKRADEGKAVGGGQVPSDVHSYEDDHITSTVSGTDSSVPYQDGYTGNLVRRDAQEDKKCSLSRASLSAIELNMSYGIAGSDFKETTGKDNDIKSDHEGSHTFGRRDGDERKMSEITTSFPEEEVLEVARQAAEEVEQMERWKDGKSAGTANDKDAQDANSLAYNISERDTAFADVGRDHRWKSHISLKDEESRKRSVYSEIPEKRVDQGSGLSAGHVEDNVGRSSGVDRILGSSAAPDIAEKNSDGQDYKRRANEGRTGVRVSAFHSNKLLALPSLPAQLTPTNSSIHFPVKRSLPAGEPTTPEQATETTGPNDGLVGGSDVSERPDFDLNEGFPAEESHQDDATTSLVVPVPVVAVCSSVVLQSNGVGPPVAVVTATKGPFVLPASPMRTKTELGWKGSAATSAFRPAEPRRTPDRHVETVVFESLPASHLNLPEPTDRKIRPPLDIDLNVADERETEELVATAMAASAGFSSQSSSGCNNSQQIMFPALSGVTFQSEPSCSGIQQSVQRNLVTRPVLDLNLMDESEEGSHLLDSDPQAETINSTRSNHSSSSQATCRIMRDFDLNDGPLTEDPIADDLPRMHPTRASRVEARAPILSSMPVLRRNTEIVNMAPWFGTSSFPSVNVAIPSFTNRDSAFPVGATGGPQSYLGGAPGTGSFSTDLFRGSANLASVPPVAFPSSSQAFQYGSFPLAPGFGYASAASFTGNNTAAYVEAPGASSFSIASSGVVPSSFVRPPFLIPSLADMAPSDISGGNSGGWGGRPSLDLNAGPDSVDVDGGRDDVLNVRQTPILTGQVSLDQLRAFRVAPPVQSVGAPVPKRKEPEGGWDMYRGSGFKQQAWR